MKPPLFITEFEGKWLLNEDTYIRPAVIETKRLNWDDVFKRVVDKSDELGKHGVMVDAGAFIGDTTEWFAKTHKCVCFEPQRDAFTCLAHNMPYSVNYPYPLGNGEDINLETEGNVVGNLGARGVMPGSQVKTLRLDDLDLNHVGVLKIDVEGWEPHLLEGAKQTIQRCSPLVVVEINLSCLVKRGFAVADIEKHFEGWQSEVIYRHLDEQWDTMFWKP